MSTEAKVNRSWALLAISLGFGVVQLDVSVVNVAIEPIRVDLGGSVADLQWVVNAYTVALAACILSAGALGDRLGAKRLFLGGFGVFTIASAGCGLAPTLPVLIGLRAVQGVAASVLVPCSLSLLNHAYSDDRARARAVGLWAAGASVAVAAGPLVGGALAAIGWRWIFFINAPVGVLGIMLSRRFVSETTRTARALDLPGQLLAVSALVVLTAGLVARDLLLVIVSVVLSGLFVLIEVRQLDPMLPLSLFRSGAFSIATSIGLMVNIAFYGLIFLLSLYFQTIRHWSAFQTGLALLPTAVAVFIGNVGSGRVAARLGTRSVLIGATVLLAAGLVGLLSVVSGQHYPALVGPLTIIGLGLGLIVPAMTATVLGSVAKARSGIASGALNMARQTGSALGVALFGAFAANGVVAGLQTSLTVSIVLAGLIFLLAWWIPHRR